MRRKFTPLWTGLLTIFLVSAAVASGSFLIDNFNDGNDAGWSHFDAAGGTDWGPAIYDASSGSYHLGTTGFVPVDDPGAGFVDASWEASADNHAFANGFVRGTIRANTAGTTCGLLMRSNDELGTDYGFYGSSSFGTFYIERFDASRPSPQTIIAMADPACFPFRAGEAWNLECGVVGDRLSLKAWRVGTREPKLPILTVRDATFGPRSGTEICALAMFDPAAVTEPVQVSATFDNISFSRSHR